MNKWILVLALLLVMLMAGCKSSLKVEHTLVPTTVIHQNAPNTVTYNDMVNGSLGVGYLKYTTERSIDISICGKMETVTLVPMRYDQFGFPKGTLWAYDPQTTTYYVYQSTK